jgi:hypothetical protein
MIHEVQEFVWKEKQNNCSDFIREKAKIKSFDEILTKKFLGENREFYHPHKDLLETLKNCDDNLENALEKEILLKSKFEEDIIFIYQNNYFEFENTPTENTELLMSEEYFDNDYVFKDENEFDMQHEITEN